jgi:hypothetical protein
VRLFNSGTAKRTAKLAWSEPKPGALWLSDTSEKPHSPLRGSITLQPQELVTIRAENGPQK